MVLDSETNVMILFSKYNFIVEKNKNPSNSFLVAKWIQLVLLGGKNFLKKVCTWVPPFCKVTYLVDPVEGSL